jgi:hypothetical protein
MASDSIDEIINQINLIPLESKDVDFLIVSNGGDPIVALRIITLLRERFTHISVLVPYVAFSAATILALGADEIVMHPYSNLGPVDPQLSVARPNGIGLQSQVQFSSEDIRNYIEFIRADVGITDQEYLMSAFSSLAAEVGSIPIGSAKRSQQLSQSLSTKLLATHMDDKSKAESIAKALNTSYYHHGYAVGRKEAQSIGLNIEFPEKEVEDVMWAIWYDFCNEMKCNQAFDPISEIMNNPEAKQVLSSVPIISLPVNTPLPIAQNIMAQMAQQNAQLVQQSPIEILQLLAAIESSKTAYTISNKLNAVYWRDANMSVAVNITPYSSGWETISSEEV